ncbi:MAG: hypothetical protein HY903_13845 [Deltaproteobacteria bacterium]|nr:hypothetical protein [Deltaproteobacteria bacterium]
MTYDRHFHEPLPPDLRRLFRRRQVRDLKIDLWNAFVDTGLLEINDADVSVLPRLLPLSYHKVIVRTCRDLTELLMRFLSLPQDTLERHLIDTPVTRFLVDELGVLKHRKRRICGSLRYDLAIVGEPCATNPPKLFEINEIGFDGAGRSSLIQSTLFALFPELANRVRCVDTAGAEARNLRRLGRRILRLQYDSYNWEEEVLVARCRQIGVELELVSPALFGLEIDADYPLLKRGRIGLERGQVRVRGDRRPFAGTWMGYSFSLDDYREAAPLFALLTRAQTPQYAPFLTGLFAPKSTLVLLSDAGLRERLLGRARARRLGASILPATLLAGHEAALEAASQDYVIKHVDGMGGEQVFLGIDARRRLARIPKAKRREWVIQERTRLNTIDVDGFASRRRRVIADLGAYVQYDWDGERFSAFEVGGFITRATNRSQKVNVSGGGIQVPVMFDVRR